ncbi:hypothetical protein EJ063_00785 [Vibrio aquaticus]|uniref:Uncharacterized protein n=1 Tax=Vibrio aquaticus TaxID=2496559 RepID=A0A3S0PQL0_9VIBR|nr:putative phage abortive infection protein [Vibrio aquaticus]RTZ17349.1 hypothetical protein EJ063_00785 [Vibrio aquaticus]
MTKLNKTLRYKQFTGTVNIMPDGSLSGEVEGLRKNHKYEGKTLTELNLQFKNRVELFYNKHAHYGIKAKSKKRITTVILPSVAVVTIIFLLVNLWLFYLEGLPFNALISGEIQPIKEQMEWWDKASSFFNNISSPLLSFISFTALLYTIHQQTESHKLSLKELALTREELEMTRTELAQSTIAHQKQADAHEQQVLDAQKLAEEQRELAKEQQRSTQVQQFENTFFSLLANHEKSLNKITEKNDGLSIVDRELSKDKLKRTEKVKHYNFFECNEMTSYFIVLYQLLKFIKTYPHNDNIQEDNKVLIEKKYTSLVRAYIPNNVLVSILLNCIIDNKTSAKYNKFVAYRDIIERYSFLEHVSIDSYSEIIDLKLLGNTYSVDRNAFGENVGLIEESVKSEVILFYKNIIQSKIDSENHLKEHEVIKLKKM